MAIDTVLLQYCGKQRPWKDNIRNSGRIWPKPNSVLEMPATEKWSYLAHPALFREITRREAEILEAETSNETLQPVMAAISALSDDGLVAVLAFVEEEAERRAEAAKNAPPPAAPVPVVEGATKDDVAASGDLGQIQAYAARIQRIADGIKQMDLKYDLHATKGMPIPSAVQEHCGVLPTPEEVIEAMKVLGLEVPVSAETAAAERAARADKILAAVGSLNRDSADDFTSNNKPRVERVKALTGLDDVTAAEIAAALGT